MRYRVDSISDGIARLEDESGALLLFSASSLPEGARDGSCLKTRGGLLVLDPDAESLRRTELFTLQQTLKNR